jgi:uncharacterized protein (TIGR01777 family)
VTAKRVVIAGANGFIGTYLSSRFRADGDTVVTIGRTGADVAWGDGPGIEHAIDGSDLLINLAGKSVNCRYSEKNKAAIFSSRLLTTAALGVAVDAVGHPPAVWMNASTATIYRHADDQPQTDEAGQLGSGFSVNVATAWEREFFAADRPGVRQVALRLAIVLGDGSALTPLLGLARVGLGGPQIGGKTKGGRQRFSWVHIEDVYRAIRFIDDDASIEGPINVTSPNPVENRELMSIVRRVVGAHLYIPLWEWMLSLGAFAIRTETELLLKSRWVVPSRLLAKGFTFAHADLEDAVRSVTGRQG